MRVLLVHNYYQRPGGEDQVFSAEGTLLEHHGHHVCRYTLHNDDISKLRTPNLAKTTLWNRASYQALRRIMRSERIQVMHVHNTLPLVSPSAYYAARDEGVRVVQTLHNYRLLCPKATLFRDGHVCEDCLHKAVPWPAVAHACYRDSRRTSSMIAAMLALHRWRGTYRELVDVYIALTTFARDKFVEGGLPEEKIVVKPNFLINDMGRGLGEGGYGLFVGRISEEKGVETLLAGWKKLNAKFPLKILGDGPLAPELKAKTADETQIEWLGHKKRQEVSAYMQNAAFLVFPSVWFEGYPMTLIEAFAAGLPVVASDLGSMKTILEHGRTGLLFSPGDPDDLAAQLHWLLFHPHELAHMRQATRAEFEAKYTAEANYPQLMRIYEKAMGKT